MQIGLALSLTGRPPLEAIDLPTGTIWTDQADTYWTDQAGSYWIIAT